MPPIDEVNLKNQYAKQAECGMVGRERACSMLRRKARQLHAQAVRFDNLADYCEHISPEIDETLFQLIIESKA